MQNINNFYKFVSEDETMANFQRKYGIHNTSALAHNRRHRKHALTLPSVNGEILADIQSSMNNLVRIGKQINLNYSNSVGEQILSKCLNVILPSTIAGTELIDKVKRHSIDTVINAIK